MLKQLMAVAGSSSSFIARMCMSTNRSSMSYAYSPMTSLQRSLKTSDLFVAALENEGVEYIFAVPGALSHQTSVPFPHIRGCPWPEQLEAHSCRAAPFDV